MSSMTEEVVFKEPTYFFANSFISIIESIYKCKSYNYKFKNNNAELNSSLMECKSLFGKKMASMPLGYYPPLSGENSIENHEKAIEKAIEITDKKPKFYLEYKTYARFEDSFVKENQLKVISPSIVSELQLCESYDEQLKGFKKSLKQNLRTTARKAESERVVLQETTSIDDLKKWYHLLVKLYRDKHQMITQPYELYHSFLTAKDTEWQGKLLVAKKDENIIGGIFILADKNHWEYSWAATDPNYNYLGINTLLVNFGIKLAIEAKAKTYSFGSTPPTDEKLIYFKSRWGCIKKPIYYYYWNHIPKPIDLNSDYKLIRSLYKFIPIWFLKMAPKYLVPLLI